MDTTKSRPAWLFTGKMLATYNTCRRRYQIEYELDYRLNGRRPWPWPPSLKVVLHAALRARDRALAGEHNGRLLTMTTTNLVVDNYVRHLKRAAAVKSFRDDKTDRIDAMAREAKEILAHYEDIHGDDNTGMHTKFMRAKSGDLILSKLHEAPFSCINGWTYAEIVDGIVNHNGFPSVLVRKFTANKDLVEVEKELNLDLGLHGFMAVASYATGEDVCTAIVDIVRTKAPSIPETVTCRKCSGNGQIATKEENSVSAACQACGGTGFGGMSKQACDTTIEIWDATVLARGLDVDEEAKRCNTLVDGLARRGETFVRRVVVSANPKMVSDWKHYTAQTVESIHESREKDRWPKNPDACAGNSSPCPYRISCCAPSESTEQAVFVKHVEPYPGLMD